MPVCSRNFAHSGLILLSHEKADKDARVGSKSKTSQFFGYKDEYIMTADERTITAADVHSGEYVDGAGFEGLLERTKESGIKPTEVYGDKAYFRKDILDTVKENKAEAYIPVSACTYKIDEELYGYDKDSDQWFCIMGNHTVRKEKRSCKKRGKNFDYYVYTFQREGCAACPHRAECFGSSKGKVRNLHVALNTAEFYEISQRQKTAEFLEKYRMLAAHEWKNGEQKRFYGLVRVRGFGLKSVSVQAKMTAIAVNLKRIAAIIGEKKPDLVPIIAVIHIHFGLHERRVCLSDSAAGYGSFQRFQTVLLSQSQPVSPVTRS